MPGEKIPDRVVALLQVISEDENLFTWFSMNMNIKTVFAVIALFLWMPCTHICAQDGSTPVQPLTEQSQALQGSWEGVEVGREGEGKCTITITGNSIHFKGSNKNEWYKATFTVPPGTDPRQLHGTITDCPQPDYVGKVAIAIFKIAEGTLTLVGHEPGAPDVPKTFEGDKTSRTFVFKKAQTQTGKAASTTEEMLKKAKIVGIGCRLFALDHAGIFPPKLSDLLPDYLPRPSSLMCALCPEEPIGYDYFACAADAARQVALRSKAPTADGKWIVVYNNADTELVEEQKTKK